MATGNITIHLDTDTSQAHAALREAAIDMAVTAVYIATREAEGAALKRAQAVAALVKTCDGNQSEAARRLGLHQSTINKLVVKATRAATTEGETS